MEIRKCPLCGATARADTFCFGEQHAVVCSRKGCEIDGPARSTKKAAIRAWNVRASDAEIINLRKELAEARDLYEKNHG